MPGKLIESYRRLLFAEGNQFIASEFAVQKVAQIIKRFNVKNVLEVGLGIGSISGSVLAAFGNRELNYHGTEVNEFCLKALNENLGECYKMIRIFKGIKEVDTSLKYDLVIIDGKDEHLKDLKKLIAENGIIAVEGDRLSQLASLKEKFPNYKYVHLISLKRNSGTGPFPENSWQGGLKIIFAHPTWQQKMWWLKEKVKTKLKYQYPGRYFGS